MEGKNVPSGKGRRRMIPGEEANMKEEEIFPGESYEDDPQGRRKWNGRGKVVSSGKGSENSNGRGRDLSEKGRRRMIPGEEENGRGRDLPVKGRRRMIPREGSNGRGRDLRIGKVMRMIPGGRGKDFHRGKDQRNQMEEEAIFRRK